LDAERVALKSCRTSVTGAGGGGIFAANSTQAALRPPLILDTTGPLIMLQKLDNTQNGSVEIAIGKARAALDFRRPSKAMQDVVAGGGAGLRLLSVRNMLAPVIVDGKVVGAVGVSGVTSEQDAQVAMAGAAAAK
jgi:glc operon protein GlcG